MVIEVAPTNSLQLLQSCLETSTRVLAMVLGLGIVAGGAALMVMPGFDSEGLAMIKLVMGLILVAVGVSFARVGCVRKPVELAFDRSTQEWKLVSRKGTRQTYEDVAPRGSVLTLRGLTAAMHNDRAEPLFHMHVDAPVRAVLVQESRRMQAAV
ncbi:MAG: hypothetical protein JXQ85_06710 [Cognatishimia sp.]|uniref:hypothetical protein n=1 Tax=Cognatishimia sp. TaxID=2211648 RepID=UPI003B8E1BD1